MIATLKLESCCAKQLVHSFMDRYLRLSQAEEKVYNQEVRVDEDAPEREAVMQIVNQWEERAAKRTALAARDAAAPA